MWRSKPALEPRDMLAHPLLQALSLSPVAPAPGVQIPPEVATTASGATACFIRSCAPNSRLKRPFGRGESSEAPPLVGGGESWGGLRCALVPAPRRSAV